MLTRRSGGLSKLDKWQTAVRVLYMYIHIHVPTHMYIGKAEAVVVVINYVPYLLKATSTYIVVSRPV